MRAATVTGKLLLITIAAMAAAYFATGTVNVSGIRPSNWTAADIIRHRCPIRLVKLEWVEGSTQPDTVMNWPVAETYARLGLVGFLWLGSSVIIVWRFAMSRNDTTAPEPTAARLSAFSRHTRKRYTKRAGVG